MVVGPLLHRACQGEFDDVRIVKIQTRMWKIWPVENYGWMKKFHPNVG